jgi:type VI secretion system secreted protein VgrG
VLPGAADKDKAGSLMDQALLNAPPEKVKPKAFFVFSE